MIIIKALTISYTNNIKGLVARGIQPPKEVGLISIKSRHSNHSIRYFQYVFPSWYNQG